MRIGALYELLYFDSSIALRSRYMTRPSCNIYRDESCHLENGSLTVIATAGLSQRLVPEPMLDINGHKR